MFRLLSQAGIIVELMGAIWLAYSAYRSHKAAKDSIVQQLHWGLEDTDRRDSLEGRLSIALQEIAGEFAANARDQWRAQLLGFAILAAGLALQFVGTFGA